MKKMWKRRVGILSGMVLIGLLSAAFLRNQESRDFRIAKNLDIFYSFYRELNAFYVDEINPDKIIKTGIDDILKSLDPYTVYYPESELDEFAVLTTGKYGGIGCLVRNSANGTVIASVYRGFPADIAGIKPGDIVKKIDGTLLKDLDTDKVSEKLKGEPGTSIVITVERNGGEKDFEMKRQRISIPSVPFHGMINDKTGYIRFTSFTQNCIEEVSKAVTDLKAKNPESIILDLRGNPGGLLNEAVEIVNLFVEQGNEVVTTRGKVKQFDATYKTTKAPVDSKVRLAVLINSGSASASEIVAGAIQDLDRGVIIGQRSYGKGLVQITRPLSYNTQLKITTAKYYIPSGRCIQAHDFAHRNEDGSVGLIPDSLIKEFKTRKGRIVKDGGGIAPDINVKLETLSQVATELYLRNFIFDFATEWYWKHQSVKNPEDFTFSNSDFEEFRSFLRKKNFSFKTATESSVDQLLDIAKKEKYYDVHKELLDRLSNELNHSLDEDLNAFKDEITEILSDEIYGRYFYEDGAIRRSVADDKAIQKAIEILANTQLYTSILDGKSGDILARGN